MAKFVFLYSSTNVPTEPPAPEHMQLWVAYFQKIQASLVDHGAPFLPNSQVLGGGNASGVTGYSIVQADNIEAAIALTEGHPMLTHGGSIQVLECLDLSGQM